METERKEILLDNLKSELSSKSVDEISMQSIERIAEILNLELSDLE